MPKESRIEPVHIPKAQWIKKQEPPKDVLEGNPYGTNIVVIRYSVDEVGEDPNLHMHPYDEIFHILEGTVEFTVAKISS